MRMFTARVVVNEEGKVVVHAFERSEEQDRDALSYVILDGEFDDNYGNPLVHSNIAGGSGHDTWTDLLAWRWRWFWRICTTWGQVAMSVITRLWLR